MTDEIIYKNPITGAPTLGGFLTTSDIAEGYTGEGNAIGIGRAGARASSSAGKTSSAPAISDINELDIAQSHHYVIQLGGFTHYLTPENSFTKFLPVKSIQLSYTNYENTTIPLAIFGDFPLLNRKRMSALSLTCFDMDNNKLERELIEWENQCFPQNKYVAYIEDVARELIYRGYDVKGRQTLEKRMFVIPSGGVSVSRDYSANDAKLVTFSVIAVGNGSNSSTGNAPHIFESIPRPEEYAGGSHGGEGYVGGGHGGGGGSSW